MVVAIALAFCWNPGNPTQPNTARSRKRQQPSGAGKAFADAKLHSAKIRSDTRRFALVKTFPNFLSEMGQQNEKVARVFATRARIICAAQKFVFIKRRLVHPARLLRCVHLDAAMHNRNSGTGLQIGFDFGVERAQHQNNALMSVHAIVLNYLVH
jgi:hypothetical protein